MQYQFVMQNDKKQRQLHDTRIGMKRGSGITELWNSGSGKRDKTREKE